MNTKDQIIQALLPLYQKIRPCKADVEESYDWETNTHTLTISLSAVLAPNRKELGSWQAVVTVKDNKLNPEAYWYFATHEMLKKHKAQTWWEKILFPRRAQQGATEEVAVVSSVQDVISLVTLHARSNTLYTGTMKRTVLTSPSFPMLNEGQEVRVVGPAEQKGKTLIMFYGKALTVDDEDISVTKEEEGK